MNEDEIVKEAVDLLSPELKFISYDGRWPNLCAGHLILSYGNDMYVFESHSLSSGGSVSFDENWNAEIDSGNWYITEWPEGFPESLKEKAIELVNENVDQGCCGGCV